MMLYLRCIAKTTKKKKDIENKVFFLPLFKLLFLSNGLGGIDDEI